MATPISRASTPRQMIGGDTINAIIGTSYGSVDNEHEVLFDVANSDGYFEKDVRMTGFGLAPVKEEGDTLFYDTASEGESSRYEHQTIAIGFQITQEQIEDNRALTLAPKLAAWAARSMAATKQQKAANIFNNGFNSSYVGGDGAAFFSASHNTIGDGAQSNTFSVDFSETAIENMLIAVDGMKDDRGILIGAKAKSLHIPKELRFVAYRLLESEKRSQTADNDPNAIREMGMFPGGVHVNHRFTDTDAFFIRTDINDGAKHFVRKGLEQAEDGDFDTGNYKKKLRERYSFGWSDYRSFVGSQGA